MSEMPELCTVGHPPRKAAHREWSQPKRRCIYMHKNEKQHHLSPLKQKFLITDSAASSVLVLPGSGLASVPWFVIHPSFFPLRMQMYILGHCTFEASTFFFTLQRFTISKLP